MQPQDVIILAAILLIIGGAFAYIVRAKRKGNKCIGCPNAACCSRLGTADCEGKEQ